MCLSLLDTEIKVAQEDIVCYKVMEKQGETLISPYQNMRYKCGEMYVSETPITVKYGIAMTAYVEEGFHTFSNKKEAQHFASTLPRWMCVCCYPCPYVVVKCLIPAGTRYVRGVFFEIGKSFNSFCSGRIMALEEV